MLVATQRWCLTSISFVIFDYPCFEFGQSKSLFIIDHLSKTTVSPAISANTTRPSLMHLFSVRILYVPVPICIPSKRILYFQFCLKLYLFLFSWKHGFKNWRKQTENFLVNWTNCPILMKKWTYVVLTKTFTNYDEILYILISSIINCRVTGI